MSCGELKKEEEGLLLPNTHGSNMDEKTHRIVEMLQVSRINKGALHEKHNQTLGFEFKIGNV